MVQVGVRVRNDNSVAMRDDVLHGLLVQPGLDDGVLVEIGAEVQPDLLPEDAVALIVHDDLVILLH